MLSSFSLKLPQQIIFGPGKLRELESILNRFGARPLLVLGSRSFAASGQSTVLEKIFAKLGIQVPTVHISSEPSPEMIDTIVADLVADLAAEEIDLVIALGGGSVLDGGKAISVMLKEKGEVTRFLEGVGSTTPSGRKLPFIAIPTTSGTGSEATSNAVISFIGSQGFKSSLRHDNFIPDLALVDPNLTLSCPKELTVACGMDCFSQLVEGYLSTNSSSVTDALALDGLKAINRSLRLVCADGGNLPARTDLAYAALLSGVVLCNSGLGTVHGFASALGGLFPIPHGLVCGTLMAPVNALTLKNLRTKGDNDPALTKYAQLGHLFSEQRSKTNAWYQDYFIEELARLADDLAIAPLSAFGVSSADIESIVSKTGNKYNPTRLTEENMATILRSRIGE